MVTEINKQCKNHHGLFQMSESENIRVGIIGAGSIVSQKHLPGLLKIPGVEVKIVCNRTLASASAVANKFSIAEYSDNWRDVVSREDIDVIWIGTTPDLHALITVEALNHGKHVFCQARMADSYTGAQTMLACANQYPNLVTMICPPPNAMRYGLYLKHLLGEKVIGDLHHFQLHSLISSWSDPMSDAHWRQRKEISGINILSVGIYAEVLERLFGEPKSLIAQGRVCHKKRSGYEVLIPDYLQVLARWENELDGSLVWSGVAHHGGDDYLQIFGTLGTIAYNFSKDKLFLGLRGDDQLKEIEVPLEYQRNWKVEENFISAVLNQSKVEPSFDTGLKYMRFVEAVNRSLSTSERIYLDKI